MVLFEQDTIIPATDADIHLFNSFLGEHEANNLFRLLHSTIPWQQDYIKMYGQNIAIPRLQAWYGDPGCSYSYSGIQLRPLGWTSLLLEIKKRVESAVGTGFNSVLINLYRDGRDSNGWHSDDEPELGQSPIIASLSLGAVRRFRLRHRQGKAQTVNLDLTPGSLLVMAGDTQKYWQHCVTKTARKVKPRINLTFRCIVGQ